MVRGQSRNLCLRSLVAAFVFTVSKMELLMSSSSLLSPVSIGSLTLKNRVAMAPMTRARAGYERMPNARMAKYYSDRASAGLIISEGIAISEQALGWNQSPGIYTDAMQQAWRDVIASVQGAGGVIFAQLWHCGRASHSTFRQDGSRGVAPSAIAINGDYIHTPTGKQSYEVPRALETTEIAGVVEDYRRAAERAKAAGFDGIELHGANGYLIDSFLQSKTNQRTDQYGGSVENRFRFLKEILEAVTSVWPANRVGVRHSPNGVYNDMGSADFRETFSYAAQQLDKCGLAYFHVMDGLGFGFHQLGEPMTLAEFRTLFHGPLIGNCGYTQEAAEAAIDAGHADLIAFGRPFISNPDFVERIAHGWPLNPPAEMAAWYSFDDVGYNDFPKYQPM